MQGYVPRVVQSRLRERLAALPIVALLGPRQCGKTTLVRETVGGLPGVVYLDLERPSDLAKLRDPELYFNLQRTQGSVDLFCLDEIQRLPEIFPLLRSLADEVGRNGQFLLLGSASRELILQTSESLAGRIDFLELTPFLASELPTDDPAALLRLWLRGGGGGSPSIARPPRRRPSPEGFGPPSTIWGSRKPGSSPPCRRPIPCTPGSRSLPSRVSSRG